VIPKCQLMDQLSKSSSSNSNSNFKATAFSQSHYTEVSDSTL
jgi:hypothetical protein